MKNVKIKILTLLMMVSVVLTGCVEQEMSMVINPDGSSTFTIVQKIDKEAFRAKCKANGMKQADINDCYKSFEKSGYKLTKIDDKEYYVQTKKGKSKKGELSKQFKDFDADAYASVNAVHFMLDMKSIPEVAELIAEAEDCGVKLPKDAITFTISLEFPYKIVNTTGQIDKENPYKVTFKADLGKKIKVFASTKEAITQKSFIKPGKINIKVLKARKNGKVAYANISFKKVKYATSYQVQYTKNSNNTGYKTISTKKHYAKAKKLQKGTKYYFRVRGVRRLYNGRTVYGKWTNKTVVTPD